MAIHTTTSPSFGQMSWGFYSQLSLIICALFAIRVAVSMWGHSGEGKPPMYGDLEAQRHWMEITTNLPVQDWYVDTPGNDLQYWGLDYPPLTAYHMMMNGYAAWLVNPEMVALESSRGIETKNVKIFMRCSVFVMDILVYIPVVVAYFILMKEKGDTEMDVLLNIIVLLGYPGLILIDHGHFQYNNVSLGLFILTILALALKYDLLGAVIFCLALNYKQMELYHATPMFFYLLGLCIKHGTSKGLYKLMTLGMVVIITFLTLWAPFLTSKTTAVALVQRIFPVNRGLYEDKVANVWCSISVVIKLKQLLSHSAMAVVCLLTTLLALIPSSTHLLKQPKINNLQYALINSSLIFFLFSFHVHEKSILLAAIPVSLFIRKDPLPVMWFLLISTFSMLPLLIKDGVIIPTISLCGIFWLIGIHYLPIFKGTDNRVKWLFHMSILIAVCLGVATLTIPPPERYPDIFPLFISMYSCGHFILFALYFHSQQLNYDFRIQLKWKKKGNGEMGTNVRPQISESSTGTSSTSMQTPRNLRKRK